MKLAKPIGFFHFFGRTTERYEDQWLLLIWLGPIDCVPSAWYFCQKIFGTGRVGSSTNYPLNAILFTMYPKLDFNGILRPVS